MSSRAERGICFLREEQKKQIRRFARNDRRQGFHAYWWTRRRRFLVRALRPQQSSQERGTGRATTKGAPTTGRNHENVGPTLGSASGVSTFRSGREISVITALARLRERGDREAVGEGFAAYTRHQPLTPAFGVPSPLGEGCLSTAAAL